MVDVVSGHTQGHLPHGMPRPFHSIAVGSGIEAENGVLQHPVLLFQQSQILLPVGESESLVAGKEVAALQGEGVPLPGQEPVSHRVLPVRAVESQFPDIVTLPAGPVEERPDGEAAQASEEIRAVPGRLAEGLVEQKDEAPGFFGHDRPPGRGADWGYNTLRT